MYQHAKVKGTSDMLIMYFNSYLRKYNYNNNNNNNRYLELEINYALSRLPIHNY